MFPLFEPASTRQAELVAKFAAGVVILVANLPPVSLIPVAICRWQFAGVIDTGGKFATGVVDTGGAP